MNRDYRFLFAPLAAIILACGIAGLSLLVPGYSHIQQTVSEIGEVGSPARIPFAIMLCAVAICILVFAFVMRDLLARMGRSQLAAYLVGFMAVSAAGVGVFAYPHPLHNIFGLSELIGYQAPLALALTWKREDRAKAVVAISWILYLVIVGAIALNLSPSMPTVWVYLKPIHGLLQRGLFAGWFGWCAAVGLMLYYKSKS